MNTLLELPVPVRSMVCVPIVAPRVSSASSAVSGRQAAPKPKPIAILRVVNKMNNVSFTPTDERLLSIIAHHIGECLSKFQVCCCPCHCCW